jgi:hypothetical protein
MFPIDLQSLYHDMISSVSALAGYRITELPGVSAPKEKRLLYVG